MRRSSILAILAGAAAACAALVPFLWRLERASFHLDETSWILASQHEPGTAEPPGPGHNFGWPSPPIGKYLIDASLRLRERDLAAELAGLRWSTYDRPIIASLASGQVPPSGVLVSARLPMAVLGAATCLVLFAIGRAAWGTRAGLIAAAMLALNPLMLICCRRAMIDAPAIFFSCVAVLFCSSRSRSLLRALGVGAAIGLALASKLNALAAAAASLSILAAGSFRREDRARSFAAVGVAALAAGVLFVAVNPYLYSDPASRTWAIFTFTHYEERIPSLGAKALLVARRLLVGEADPTGSTYLTFRSLIGLPLEWALLPVGCIALTKLRPSNAAGLSILVWWGATLVAIAWWLPQDWERYYLPALPPTILITARGLDLVMSGALNRRRSRQHDHAEREADRSRGQPQ